MEEEESLEGELLEGLATDDGGVLEVGVVLAEDGGVGPE